MAGQFRGFYSSLATAGESLIVVTLFVLIFSQWLLDIA